MDLATVIKVLTFLMGIGVSVLLAAIPWAYSVHGRLTKIEMSLNNHLENHRQLLRLEQRVSQLEQELATQC